MTRGAAGACVLVLLLGAGCGGDGDGERSSERAAPTTPSPRSDTARAPVTQPPPETSGQSPEEKPGGGGDEQPARVPASFTGRGGRVFPRSIHVPPYIAVAVGLRSVDGRSYSLRFPGAALETGAAHRTDSAMLDGLRPGRSAVGRSSESGPVRIVADAEPGP